MSGWANIDYGGNDPRFGDYYGAGYSGYDSQPYLGYYGGYNAGSYAYPTMPPEEYGGYGAQRYAYPNVGSPFGSGYYGTDQYGYPYYGSGYGMPPYAGNPTPAYPGFGPTTGYGRRTSGYLQGNAPTNQRQRTQHPGTSWRQGPHAGKGPKRSDARIQDEVSARLTQHGNLDASNITVQVDHGEVTLSGSVSSRQDKREAERVADAVPGVQDVHNQLTIQAGSSQAQNLTVH